MAREQIITLDKMTLADLLKEAVKRYSSQPCVALIDTEPLTYKDVQIEAEKAALNLISMGIKKGDKVAILSENMPNWVVSYFAVALTGATAVPVLPDFHDEEIQNILVHSEAKVVFASQKLIAKIISGKKIPCKVISIETMDFSEVLEGQQNTAFSDLYEIPHEEEDIAAIIYTSGTTGSSKGVMLTNKNIVSNAVTSSYIPEITKKERFVSILPLSHTYECTIGMLVPFCVGASVYYLGKPPVPAVLLPALKAIKPGVMLSVPLLIEKIYRNKIKKNFDSSPVISRLYKIGFFRLLLNRIAGIKLKKTFGGRIYFFGVGGAPLAEDVEKFLREAKFPYAIGYGLTETSPLIAGDNAYKTRFRSTGRILEGVQVKIDSPDPEKIEGEILVKGPNIMKGYYKNPELTKEVFTEDGWFKTGDLGIFAEEGYLHIKGRIKNLILGPSGENIYPESIEQIINSSEFVEDSLVLDNKGRIVALVHLNYDELKQKFEELKEGAAESGKQFQDFFASHLEDVRKKVNSKLSSFSRISEIVEHEKPFEKTPTKKIKRYLYRNFIKKE